MVVMHSAFSDVVLPSGHFLEIHDQLSSTNEQAAYRAREGARPNTWTVAEHQSNGRGRHGRVWFSGSENLYASLFLHPEVPVGRFFELSFVAACAVANIVQELTPLSTVQCKWPNDVLINGKKVSGILIESETSFGLMKPWAIIGIGLNVTTAPDGVDFPAAALKDFVTKTINKFLVFQMLTESLAKGLALWRQQGFAPVRSLWSSMAWQYGQEIVLENEGERLKGVHQGINDSGALLLREPSGKCRAIISGTVRASP